MLMILFPQQREMYSKILSHSQNRVVEVSHNLLHVTEHTKLHNHKTSNNHAQGNHTSILVNTFWTFRFIYQEQS